MFELSIIILIFFSWIFLSAIMYRILSVLLPVDDLSYEHEVSFNKGLISSGAVLFPISCIILVVIGILKLFILMSNWIINTSIKKFKEIKKINFLQVLDGD